MLAYANFFILNTTAEWHQERYEMEAFIVIAAVVGLAIGLAAMFFITKSREKSSANEAANVRQRAQAEANELVESQRRSRPRLTARRPRSRRRTRPSSTSSRSRRRARTGFTRCAPPKAA